VLDNTPSAWVEPATPSTSGGSPGFEPWEQEELYTDSPLMEESVDFPAEPSQPLLQILNDR
jgi:hypothetical protein